MKRLTSIEVSAMHALGHFYEEECVGCVEWAVSELLAGRDSIGLRILAGEHPPFDPFEIKTFKALLDRTLEELEIARIAGPREAVFAWTFEVLRQIAAGESDTGEGLSRIQGLYFSPCETEELESLADLCSAHREFFVHGASQSWFRPDCTPETIDAVILEECARWMESHPHGPSGKAISG